jgi:hypothetical protein
MRLRLGIAFLLVMPLVGQKEETDHKLPDGSSRTLMVLKSDAKKSKADIEKLIELAGELQQEIERHEYHVVDLGSLRKTEEIERLIKRIKGRMKRVQ